jgi:membrane protease YdiL (CAAX protease family)
MARSGETEHGSAEPRGALPSANEGSGAPRPSWRPLTAGRAAAGSSGSGWPPPQYPPPQYPPPQYPPSIPPVSEGGRFFDRPGTPPATRAAAGFWLVVGLVGFAIGQVVGAVFVAIAAAIAGESGQLSKFATMAAPPEWYVGTSLVGLWVGFFLGPLVASKVRGTGRVLRDLGVRFRLVDLAGIPIGLGAQVLLDALYAPFLPHLKHFTAPTQKLVGASHGWGILVIAILTVVGAPFFEEILFRGLAFRALARFFAPLTPGPTTRRALAIAAAVVVDGVLFGLAHWELYQFAGLAAFGMLLAFISYKTGRLGMNMVTHASFNFLAVLVVFTTSGGVVH